MEILLRAVCFILSDFQRIMRFQLGVAHFLTQTTICAMRNCPVSSLSEEPPVQSILRRRKTLCFTSRKAGHDASANPAVPASIAGREAACRPAQSAANLHIETACAFIKSASFAVHPVQQRPRSPDRVPPRSRASECVKCRPQPLHITSAHHAHHAPIAARRQAHARRACLILFTGPCRCDT